MQSIYFEKQAYTGRDDVDGKQSFREEKVSDVGDPSHGGLAL